MSTKNNEVIENIGQRLRAYRVKKNLTLVQLSNLIGISHGSLSGLENSKSKPSAETLSNLCLYTDIDINWLLTGKEGEKFERPNILDDLEEWVRQETKLNPKRKDWLEIQLLDSLTAFKAWKEEKERKADFELGTQVKKVA